MRKLPFAIAAAVTLAAGSFVAVQAQDGPPPQPGQLDVSRVTAGSYTADAGHSLVGWRVNHFGFNDYFGLFGNVSGTLEIDPADLSSAQVSVTIPVSGVTTANAGLTAHLLRDGKDPETPADFFGSAPADATFTSTSVELTSEETALITGDLTLNGATSEVVIDAQFSGAGKNPFSQKETIGFEGQTTINRSDFGINYGIPMVGDEVSLGITVAFEK